MSQNKTIVPGVDFGSLNKEGAADTFYESLYSRTSADDNHTCVGGGPNMNVYAATHPAPQSMQPSKPVMPETSHILKIKERVIVGVMFSISKGLLGEVIPIYLGKNIIGQNNNCDIVLMENTVSAEHAIMHTRKNENGIELTITDFNSMYGTMVNNIDARYDTLPVHENDIITIGRHYKFIVKLFDTERYGLFEDPDFEAPTASNNSPSGAVYSDNAQTCSDADFYRPSSGNDNDPSRTVIC